MFGNVKLYVASRGFGFIAADAPALPDLFLHCNDVRLQRHELEDVLLPGTRVEFEIGKGPDGRPRAVKVAVLKATMTDLHGDPAPVGKYSGFVDD